MASVPTEIVIHTAADRQATWAWLVNNGGYWLCLGPDGKLHALPLG